MSAATGLGALTGCSSSPDDAAQPVVSSPEETAPTTSAAESSETSSADTTEISESKTSEESQTDSTEDSETASEDGVAEVAQRFSTLAPASLFEQFDTCSPSGLKNSYQCTGSEVGQFQFYENSSKAASTTLYLTELRSSRVVKDDGDRVVGWSTLGSTAVITVVDNETSQIMQQMVSADQDDPEQKIKDLGLVDSDDLEAADEDAQDATKSARSTKETPSARETETTSSADKS